MKFITICAILLFAANSYANFVVGTINMQQVISEVKDGKKVMSQLEKSYNQRKEKLQKEEEKIKKIQEEYQKQRSLLSDKAKANKEKELQEMIMTLQNTTRQYQQEIQKMEAELKEPIVKKLKGIVDQVSKTEKVAITFEISRSPVVYAENQKDITEAVIKAYDKKYGK